MKSIVVYATKYGSAEKAARMLKDKLRGEVTLINIKQEKVTSLGEYDNVILGGSIYVGKLQKELTAFVKDNLKLLMSKNVGLFICAAMTKPEEIKKEFEAAFPQELYSNAAAKEVFGYEFNFEKMSFIDKMATKKIMGIKSSVSELKVELIENFAEKINNLK